MADDPTPPQPIEELLARCIDLVEQSRPENVDELLGANPEHAERVRAILHQLEQTGMVGENVAPDPIGAELGDYRLLRRLGEGGMGVVFLARQKSLDRLAAVTVIHPILTSNDTTRERFRREARAAARLRHPHLVSVFETGVDRRHRYIAMEFVPGRILAELFSAEQEPELHQIIRWVRDIARGLQSTHDNGVIHRAMERVAAQRYPSAGAFADDLDALLTHYQEIGNTTTELEADLTSRRARMIRSYQKPEVWRRLDRAEHRLRGERQQRQDLLAEIQGLLDRAAQLGAESAQLDTLRADTFFQTWRASLAGARWSRRIGTVDTRQSCRA